MKKFTSVTILALGLLAVVSACFGQGSTLTETTLSSAVTAASRTVPVASATGISAGDPTAGTASTQLFVVDPGQTLGEVMTVVNVSGTTLTVRRSNLAVAHTSGAKVYAGAQNLFKKFDPVGSCTTANTEVTPLINTTTGQLWKCDTVTGSWVRNNDYVWYVPPTQCTFAPTTLTTTNTYPQIGASNIFVLNAVSNAAAGTNTLVCNILIPTRFNTTRGVYIKDITVAIGSQVTAPTSIGTATLGTISFPTPVATTQTASVVTPVAAGSTVTQLGPTTTVLTVTTAGAFLTFKYTFATAVQLSTDLQLLQFTVPYLQSAAAAMTLNTPGLWVHATAPAL